MCGIVGILNLTDHPPAEEMTLRRMLGAIRHRGPDDFGIYRDAHVGLGSARLSIIDLTGGQQPIGNEDGTQWIVFNGEIFNYVELRAELERRGHHFSTNTDTEVVLHLYEDRGPACLDSLNGQFALAIWAAGTRELFLARDRLGIRPLFYTVRDGQLVFGSEVKAILAHPRIRAEIDRASLGQIFTFWSTLSPRTVFRDIVDVPASHYLLAGEGGYDVRRYWSLDFTPDRGDAGTPGDTLGAFESLLIDAARIRLRADVPVGAYLSGGLDSSVTTAMVRSYTDTPLETFSIAFEDPKFDESGYQERMAAFLGTDHRVARCTTVDVARVFPDVIWHTETPILRTSPAPMFLLSQLVHDQELKVVLTGEGADEILAGYNIFKENKVRRFWARQPDSQMRPLLLGRLYPYIPDLSGGAYLKAFFGRELEATASPFYSHTIRWTNTARARRFLLEEPEAACGGWNGYEGAIPLPPAFASWPAIGQAQYLEMSIFLSQYLLSSQGDRMAMAHSVEGRYPFLDYRVVEFCNALPPALKLRGLTEKWLLKQLGQRLVPAEVWQRPKQPYRAPIQRSFFGEDAPEYVTEILSEEALRAAGLFNPVSVARLAHKAEVRARLSEVDEMALVGVLSTQLVHRMFVEAFEAPSPITSDRVKLVDRTLTSESRQTRQANRRALGGR